MMFPFARLHGEYAQSAELAFLRHELAQPLTYLSSSLGLLKRRMEVDKPVDSATQRAVVAAQEATQHLMEMVRRIGADDNIEHFGPVELSELVRSTLLMVADEFSERIDIVEDVTTDVVVFASRTRLTQVLLNLLTNAALAIHERGGGRGVIRVTVAPRGDGTAILVVEDDGTGILGLRRATRRPAPFHDAPGSGLGVRPRALSRDRRVLRRLADARERPQQGHRGSRHPDDRASLVPVKCPR